MNWQPQSLVLLTHAVLHVCRVVANLKWGDGLAAPDMVCSTAFDRDDEFFATAGASRRIKVRQVSFVPCGHLLCHLLCGLFL